MSSGPPPPVIDSMRTLWFAVVDNEVTYTDRIHLIVGGERLGKVECLAICLNYSIPGDFVLCFCDSRWQCKGVIAYQSVDEAKAKAEIGYSGIGEKWQAHTASQDEVDAFLREEYDVDPKTEWWKTECSFCGKDIPDVDGILGGKSAHICYGCIREFYEHIQKDKPA